MVRIRATLLPMSLVLMAFAGCLGGGGDDFDVDDPDRPGEAEGGGSINVLVHTDSLEPIAKATVGLQETEDVKETNAEGLAQFHGLEAGTYRIDVQKLGFESVAKSVTLEHEATAEVQVELQDIQVANESFSELVVLNGFITCGTGTYVVTQVACGAADDNQEFLHEYEIEEEMTGVLWELQWESSQFLSKDLVFNIEEDGCGATCPDDSTFALPTGCCTLRVALDDDGLDIPNVKAGSEGATIQSRTFPAFQSSDGLPTVYTNQEFTIYVEYFWGELPPDFQENRTNIPDA